MFDNVSTMFEVSHEMFVLVPPLFRVDSMGFLWRRHVGGGKLRTQLSTLHRPQRTVYFLDCTIFSVSSTLNTFFALYTPNSSPETLHSKMDALKRPNH